MSASAPGARGLTVEIQGNGFSAVVTDGSRRHAPALSFAVRSFASTHRIGERIQMCEKILLFAVFLCIFQLEETVKPLRCNCFVDIIDKFDFSI